MKKNYKRLKSLALLLLIPLLGWSQPIIFKTNVVPNIDGIEDGAWSAVAWNAVTHVTAGTNTDPNWHANFKLLWDKSNIYVFLKVNDAIKGRNYKADSSFAQDQSDYADIFLGFNTKNPYTANSQNGSYWNQYQKSDFQIQMLRDSAEFCFIGGQTGNGGKRIANASLIKRAVTDANGIWTIEAAIPRAALYDTSDLAINDSIIFELCVGNASTSDTGGVRDFRTAFHATTDNAWEDPKIWDKVYLAGAQHTIITGYSENFDSPLTATDSTLWFANGAVTTTVENSKLHVKVEQKSFSDGKFFDFLNAKNVSLNLNQKPLVSFKLTIDSATWLVPDWSQGGKLVPSATMPMSISSFQSNPDTRLVQNSKDMKIGVKDTVLYYSLAADGIDQSVVDKFLLENVSWPNANKAYYWIDDIKFGDQVVLPNPITALTISTTEGTDTIKVKAGKLHFVANRTPADATIGDIAWSVIPGTGYATIDASGVLTPVSDGSVQVVAKTKDGSNVSATATVVMQNQLTVAKTFLETFNAAVNMNLWAPNGAMTGDRKTFIVTQANNALHVDMKQNAFFDGQMYDFTKWTGKTFDLSAKPFISFKLKIDSATWLAPDWSQGGKLVPQTTMPFGVSFYNGDTRLSGSTTRASIDTVTKTLTFNLFDPSFDLTKISKVLIETVEWPSANKAVFNIDDFRMGAAVSVVQDTAIDVQSATGVDTIKVSHGTLQMNAIVSPAGATFPQVAWKVIKGSGYATIDANGVLKGVSDGDVQVVAITKDGTNLSDTIAIHLVNQFQTVTTYTETFTNAVDMNLWAPNPQMYTDGTRKSFIVSQANNALVIDMKQNAFPDGQLYDFKTYAGLVFNLSAKPLASMKVKVDTSIWLAPDWGQGGKLVPQTSMPCAVSAWKGGTKLGGSAVRVPIDKSNVVYYFTFVAPGADLTDIEKILIETVEWPSANSATFEIDDFKLGNAVALPDPVTALDLTSDKDSIKTALGTAQLTATLTPANATISSLYWSVSDTALASIDQSGKLKAKKDGTVTVTAMTMDGTGITNTKDIVIAQPNGIKDMVAAGYTVYPNPTSGILGIKNYQNIKNVFITNLTGQAILNGQLQKGTVDVSGLANGVYMLRVTTLDNKTFMTKFVKQ
jgi:uncharacterized protein YjdB